MLTEILTKIKELNKSIKEIRKQLPAVDQLYNLPYSDMYEYYHFMEPKKAEKFIEGWVATLCNGKKIESKEVPDQFKKNDNGDIWIGDNLQLGVNNIELKCIFKEGGHIGGGQFRFYENVPYYMFFKAWNSTTYEIFLLTKQQLVDEIINRALSTGKNSITSSQGSGIISKLNESEKIDRLKKNLTNEYQDKLGWEFNSKTEPEFYESFQNKYKVNPDQIKNIINNRNL